MPPPKIDWSFDNAPSDAEPAPYGPNLGPGRTRAPRPRWLLASMLLVAVVAAGALGVYVATGWSRLKAQIAAEVSYEDAHARKGDVVLVQAVQDQSNPGWLARRG